MTVKPTKQPFSTKEEIENFLFLVKDDLKDCPPAIYSWIAQNLTSYSNDAAIIFVRHPLVLEKLYEPENSPIETEYERICNAKKEVTDIITTYNNDYSAIQKKYKFNIDSLGKLIKEVSASNVSTLKDKKKISEIKGKENVIKKTEW